jgi:hypothetical protein
MGEGVKRRELEYTGYERTMVDEGIHTKDR